MRASTFAMAVAAPFLDVVAALQSPKRGLVFVPNRDWPQDNTHWVRPGSGLRWYYNYTPQPSFAFSRLSQEQFSFVPMMWGTPDPPEEPSFLGNITELIRSGRNVSHVLSFNEPDGPYKWGGSDTLPAKAAKAWVANLMPLREMGIKVSLPSVMASADPLEWAGPFLSNCSALISKPGGPKKECEWDFISLHVYGDMTELKTRVGRFVEKFPGKPIWITEYALHDKPLAATQAFFNASLEYLDGLDAVERYSYFGSFRSQTSNVGPNAAMLDRDGGLTDIGSWYLGGPATGRVPSAAGRSRHRPGAMGLTAAAVAAAVVVAGCA